MAKMGRPKVNIEKEDFEKLCSMQCTLIEIAGFFDCSEDTIERWCKETYEETFADVFKRKSAKGKISVRRKQFQVADSGNATMLIWLGKQYLGQREYQDITLNKDTDDSILEMEKYFAERRQEENS